MPAIGHASGSARCPLWRNDLKSVRHTKIKHGTRDAEFMLAPKVIALGDDISRRAAGCSSGLNTVPMKPMRCVMRGLHFPGCLPVECNETLQNQVHAEGSKV